MGPAGAGQRILPIRQRPNGPNCGTITSCPAPHNGRRSARADRCRAPLSESLITDYYSYNTDVSARDQSRRGRGTRAWFQPHWVGDLTLSLRLTTREPAGKFRLELIRAGISHRCEIDLASGMAQLFRGDAPLGESVQTEITRAGVYDLAFANVDGRLTVWINGQSPIRGRPDV